MSKSMNKTGGVKNDNDH